MRSLADAGKSILFITHKLKEVQAIADVITVIRQGQGRGHGRAHGHRGRAGVADGGPRRQPDGGEVRVTSRATTVFEIRDLVVRDDRGSSAVNGVSLDVRAGEILALAGVQGNGQTELVEAIAGMRPVESGTITLQRSRHHERDAAQDPRRRAGTHPRGPPARRPRAVDVGRGQPRAQHPAPRARSPSAAPATSARCARNAETAREGLRHPHDVDHGAWSARSRVATSRR